MNYTILRQTVMSTAAAKRKLGRDETVNASAPLFKKPKADGSWDDAPDLHVYTAASVEHRAKIAAFDIDGTIITTKSGRTFAKDQHDWQFLYSEIPGRLKRLYNDEGFKVVFCTNQKGIEKGKVGLSAFKEKIEAILAKISVPIQVFVSPGALKYRKPYTGMWDELSANRNGGVSVDVSRSIYVGDAAGRTVSATRKKKDFSCGDRLFALNVGLKFQTPEQFFLNKPAEEPHTMPDFDPRAIKDDIALLEPSTAALTSPRQEVIVMVGYPGSGKSCFVKHNLEAKGYVVVNRDQLKTWQKCVSVAQEALKKGKSVVVDNTNPDKESRSRYLEMAKTEKVPCRCFVMKVDRAQALHNTKFRIIIGTDKEHKAAMYIGKGSSFRLEDTMYSLYYHVLHIVEDVNEMVLNMYKSKYQPPDVAEGFTEVVAVNFVPVFNDSFKRGVYKQFLLER